MRRIFVKVGDVIEGRYKILRAIAEGGMGTVFLAEHWLIKRRVAIKVLHPELAGDAVMNRRFMNEALAAGTLGHPNIVESTDMGFTASELPYIVFEYLEGTSLADELLHVQRMPPPRALAIVYQIASALEAAHAANIVHRDLKSDNIHLIERNGRPDHVKVLDFGISRFLEAADRSVAGGNLLGTPEFMAPEQITDPEGVDHRADLYALGVVLYEMLTGHVPFLLDRPVPAGQLSPLDIEATHRLLARIVSEPPPPLRCDDAPPGLRELIFDKLLAKDRKARLQSATEVRSALEAFVDVLPERPAAWPRAETGPLDPKISKLSDQTVSRSRLEPSELVREVKVLGKRWSLEGENLVLQVYSRTYAKLASVAVQAATIADDMDQDPHIELGLPRLRLVIQRAGEIVDLVYAARLEHWLREAGW